MVNCDDGDAHSIYIINRASEELNWVSFFYLEKVNSLKYIKKRGPVQLSCSHFYYFSSFMFVSVWKSVLCSVYTWEKKKTQSKNFFLREKINHWIKLTWMWMNKIHIILTSHLQLFVLRSLSPFFELIFFLFKSAKKHTDWGHNDKKEENQRNGEEW